MNICDDCIHKKTDMISIYCRDAQLSSCPNRTLLVPQVQEDSDECAATCERIIDEFAARVVKLKEDKEDNEQLVTVWRAVKAIMEAVK